MSYQVKEIFRTLQGEGAQAGRAAVFCRFAGCNLWSGREEDRAAAQCRFCDTDFVGTNGEGGGTFDDAAGARGGDCPGLGRVHRAITPMSSSPAASLCCSSMSRCSRLCTTKALPARSRPMARSRRPTASTGSASAPRPEPSSSRTAGDELKLVFPQEGLDPDKPRKACVYPFLPATDGRAAVAPNIPRRPSPIARRIRAGGSACRPINSLACPDRKRPLSSRNEDHPSLSFRIRAFSAECAADASLPCDAWPFLSRGIEGRRSGRSE